EPLLKDGVFVNGSGETLPAFTSVPDGPVVLRLENPTETEIKTDKLKAAFARAGVEVEVEYDPEIAGSGEVRTEEGSNRATVVLNPDRLAKDTVHHEFGHLLVDMLGVEHPTVKKAIEVLKGTELARKVISLYPELSGEDL